LKLANLVRDAETLAAARRAALTLIEKDPELTKPTHAVIRAKLQRQSHQVADLLQTS